MKTLTQSDIKKLLPRRSTISHKGENGRVLVIGGSIDYYGAPILSGLGALNSGADLVHLFVPRCNFDVSRSHVPDFIVRAYDGEYFSEAAVVSALDVAEMCDVVVLGPGLSDRKEVLRAVSIFIEKCKKPLVLDADALSAVKNFHFGDKKVVITPHAGEFADFFEKKIPVSLEERTSTAQNYAESHGITVLLKGISDIIASKDKVALNETGNAGMTVGGTGDVLSGVVASLIAQGLSPFDAALCAAYVVGAAGDDLERQKAYAYTASDVAQCLGFIIRKVLGNL